MGTKSENNEKQPTVDKSTVQTAAEINQARVLLFMLIFIWQIVVSALVGMVFLDFAKMYESKVAFGLGLAPFVLMFFVYLAWKRLKLFG